YQLEVPGQVAWVGQGLDIGANKKGLGIPMMQSKSQLIDFVSADLHLNSGTLYKLNKDLSEDGIDNKSGAEELNQRFDTFKKMNRQFTSKMKLLPDSAFRSYFKN